MYLAREKVSLLGVFFLFPVNIFFAKARKKRFRAAAQWGERPI
jgi:hypothetical protein